ncbi:fatty acid desaturase [Streptomyces sp. NPDC002537]
MPLALAVIVFGAALRQADRIRFARGRPRVADVRQALALQRARANDWTPTLLLVGQWLQISGWWMLADCGPLGAAVAAVGVAVHFRHLQEISHFAVHGVLARTARANLMLAEIFAHLPLALGPAVARRKRHVRDHHPHATRTGIDPNLAELHRAGLRPGTTRAKFTAALLHPLTPRGIGATVSGLLTPRAAVAGTTLAAAYLAGGWAAVAFGVLVPRILLYPQLAWLSLLVEHTWFDPDPRTGPPARVEAGRCLRLYPRNRALAALAAATWLPYGDLHHYAHSAHPSVRWNYLPPLERHLGNPHFTPDGLRSVARRHLDALTS